MAYERESDESRALSSIDSQKYPDTNKDFTKNMQRLNSQVDYIAGYMRVMQKGIDEASKNPIEQIQSFIANLIVLFAGGEPTGIEMGDLKYIIQTIGALFGLNGPFPSSLIAAAEHFFLGYVVPLEQFTDVIFDSIEAWAEELGFTDAFLDSFGALRDQVEEFIGLFDDIEALLNSIFRIFGLPDGGGDTGAAGGIWDIISAAFDGLNGAFLHPIFEVISTWTVPFINALTNSIDVINNIIETITGTLNFDAFWGEDFTILGAISAVVTNLINNGILGITSALNALNIFGIIPGFSLPNIDISHLIFGGGGSTGPNLLVEPGFNDSDSIQLGTGWTWDPTTGNVNNGCAKATAGSSNRELLSIAIPVVAGQDISISTYVKWSGLSYTGTQPITMNIVQYLSGVRGTTVYKAGATSPATNQVSFTQLTGTYTTPAGVDSIRLSFKVASTASAGNVWFDDAVLQKTTAGLPQSWVFNLIPTLGGISQFIQDVVDAIISVIRGIPFIGGTLANLLDDLADWFDYTQDTAAQAGDAYMVATTLEPVVATQQVAIAATQLQVVNQQNYVVTNQIASGYINPKWVCRYGKADVTFPEFYITELSLFGITAGVTGGTVTAHTHDFDINTSTAEIGSWSIVQNDSRGGYVGISQGRIADTIAILARKRTATVVDNVYLSILKENTDGSTFQVFEEEISGDLQFPDMTYLEYPIPDLIVQQPGENYMVKVRNSSTVNTTVQIQGLWQDSRAVDSAWGCTGATDSVKTSYTAAENAAMKSANFVLPWAMLAQKAEYPTDLSISDTFQRGSLGSVWKLQQSTAADHLDVVGRGYIGYYGGGGGSVAGIRTQSISTDRMRVDGYLTGTGVAPPSGLIICCDEMMTNFVLLYVNSAGAKLYSTTNGSTYTQRSTVSKGANDGMWTVYYEPSTNKFRVMQDEVLITALDWVDTGNVITHGPNKRFAGARTDAVIFLFIQTKGPLISNWNVSDWSP